MESLLGVNLLRQAVMNHDSGNVSGVADQQKCGSPARLGSKKFFRESFSPHSTPTPQFPPSPPPPPLFRLPALMPPRRLEHGTETEYYDKASSSRVLRSCTVADHSLLPAPTRLPGRRHRRLESLSPEPRPCCCRRRRRRHRRRYHHPPHRLPRSPEVRSMPPFSR